MNQLSLTDYRPPLARTSDPDTSHEAAAAVAPHLTFIQQAVLKAYREHGPMTARTCERLPELSMYGFSTVRKRISELLHAGRLETCGRDRGAVYRVVP